MINRRVVGVVVVAAVLGGVAAAVWASSQPDRYSVTTVMAVAPSSAIIDETQIIDIVGSLDRGSVTATAAGIASSTSVRDAAVEELGIAPGSLGDYEVDSVPVLGSALFDVMVSGPDPEVTAALANAIGVQIQLRINSLYDVYEVEVLTRATPPTNSARPSVVLVALLGVVVAAGAAIAVTWAAFGGRYRTAVDEQTE